MDYIKYAIVHIRHWSQKSSIHSLLDFCSIVIAITHFGNVESIMGLTPTPSLWLVMIYVICHYISTLTEMTRRCSTLRIYPVETWKFVSIHSNIDIVWVILWIGLLSAGQSILSIPLPPELVIGMYILFHLLSTMVDTFDTCRIPNDSDYIPSPTSEQYDDDIETARYNNSVQPPQSVTPSALYDASQIFELDIIAHNNTVPN